MGQYSRVVSSNYCGIQECCPTCSGSKIMYKIITYSILISNPPKAKVRYKRKEKENHFPSLKCYHDLVRTVKNKRKGKIQGAKTIFHAMAASSWYSFLEKGSQLGQSLYNFFKDFINLLFFSPPPNLRVSFSSHVSAQTFEARPNAQPEVSPRSQRFESHTMRESGIR